MWPRMEHQSQHAAKFIRNLSELAERLAERDIVVCSLHAEYSHFGSWQLIARKHHEAVRFLWDGRDSCLTVEYSPMRDSSGPNDWREEMVKGFDRVSGDDPLRFVETYLTTKFPV
jgi:hypothetical protein